MYIRMGRGSYLLRFDMCVCVSVSCTMRTVAKNVIVRSGSGATAASSKYICVSGSCCYGSNL